MHFDTVTVGGHFSLDGGPTHLATHQISSSNDYGDKSCEQRVAGQSQPQRLGQPNTTSLSGHLQNGLNGKFTPLATGQSPPSSAFSTLCNQTSSQTSSLQNSTVSAACPPSSIGSHHPSGHLANSYSSFLSAAHGAYYGQSSNTPANSSPFLGSSILSYPQLYSGLCSSGSSMHAPGHHLNMNGLEVTPSLDSSSQVRHHQAHNVFNSDSVWRPY